MLKLFHIALAYLTVLGFVVRGIWALTDSPQLQQRWVRIAPHVIDTLLLTLGVIMMINLSLSPFDGWLAAKLVGLLAYIGFGVLTMRAGSKGLKVFGFCAAVLCVAYMFAVAFTRSAWPFLAA